MSAPRAPVAPQLSAARAVAVGRLFVVATTAVAGLAWSGTSSAEGRLFVVFALVWLPWAAVLVVASHQADGGRWWPVVAYGGPVGDLAMLSLAQVLAPAAWGLFLLAQVLVLSVAAALWRAGEAWCLVAGCVGLTLLAQVLVPAEERLAGGILLVVTLALVAMVGLVGRMAEAQRRTSVVSERMKHRAETIVARVAEGIVITDGAGCIVQCNPAGERLIGRPDGSAVGAPCSVALGLRADGRAFDCSAGCPLLALHDESDPAQGRDGGREVWRHLPDGRRQPLLASAFAVDDGQGGFEVVHSLRDVTRLKEADEAKTLFLATASHELKTPATVIAGFADAIRQFPGMPTDRRDEAVDAIHRRAVELSGIVDRLLLSSKIEGGRVTVDVHHLDVRPVLNERASAVQDATGRHVILQVAPEQLMAGADPLALRTVVDHLLDNAVKYSDGGPIVLGARRAGATVAIWVSDVGIGMDADQARHCFDKFWQAESTDVRRFGGTGIGLYIVRSLVDAMGGTISVETAAGRGSTFTVELPGARAAGGAGAARGGAVDQFGALAGGSA